MLFAAARSLRSWSALTGVASMTTLYCTASNSRASRKEEEGEAEVTAGESNRARNSIVEVMVVVADVVLVGVEVSLVSD